MKILVLGLGAVARCTLPLLLQNLQYEPEQYTILEPNPSEESLKWAESAGVRVVPAKVTRYNYMRSLSAFLSEGDLLIDLAWNTGTVDILEWCSQYGVRFVNASLEVWDPYADADAPARDRTLYARHLSLRARQLPADGPTAVLDHGANPGLVSHFVKAALHDMATKCVEELPPHEWLPVRLTGALRDDDYPLMAKALNVQTIHISERDTQISMRPREVNEFVNTWSVEGFFEEATAPAELGWGTHETAIPDDGLVFDAGPKNAIALDNMGMHTWVRSWVPTYGEIQGMVIRHGEALSISDHLTYGNVYRPSVYYAYYPTDAAIASLNELEVRRYELQTMQRVMTEDIIAGRDELGVLLLGHKLGGWWYGSSLDIDETRSLVGNEQNATVLQVAASVLAAVVWAEKNPNRGVCLPDDLPWRDILAIARPYLGPMSSVQTDWTPLGVAFDGTNCTFDDFRTH